MKRFILSVIDWFYPPFRRIMPLQTFRYAACGGSNTLLDLVIFYISFTYILPKDFVHLPFLTLKSYNMALFMAFCVSFPTGFILMRTLVYPDSNLRRRVQVFRYFVQVITCMVLNYLLINAFVLYAHLYPTIARIPTAALVVTFSYLSQKHFSFRVKQDMNTPAG
jgi:putative flippase GtrA